MPITSLRTINSSNSISLHSTPNHGYIPTAAKGHKESVYALAMNDVGTILVSGGTEKVKLMLMLVSLFTLSLCMIQDEYNI